LALSATVDLFSEEDCAAKLLPVMCPSLVDKEKMIRDQAQKTVDIYIARIRKYASTMPDTVSPLPTSSSGTNAPRMGTTANDSGWAGWAISSFTNKLAAASGQIETKSNGSAQERPSSVPPPVPANKPATNASTTRPGMTLAKSNVNIPTILSPDPAADFNDDAEDFAEDWGGFGEDDGFGSTTTTTKKQPVDADEDPWGTPSVTSPATTANYDDRGEPDFAGWLAAQSQTKKPGAKPLPKGLAKSGASSTAKRPIVGGRTGSAPSVTRKVVVPPNKEVKKVEQVKSKEDEEEGWGDAW
jgi:SCY1-like protein 1